MTDIYSPRQTGPQLTAHNRLIAVAVMAVVLLLPACGDPDDSADAGPIVVETFDFQIGRIDDNDDFELLAEDDEVEIVVGFQGLIFIELALQSSDAIPDDLALLASVSFRSNPDLDYTYRINQLRFVDTDSGHRLNEDFRLAFGLDLALLKGQQIEVEVQLTATGWEGTSERRFTIVDNNNCVEGPDGSCDLASE